MKREANPNTKRDPQPVRFDPEDEQAIRELANDTGLSLATIIRHACRYAVPLFTSGKVNILSVRKVKVAK